MEGFDESDTIPSFNTSELIEEVHDEDELEVESPADSDDDDDMSSSLLYYQRTYRHAKRFKTMTADESSFKMNVFNVLKKSCAIVGDFAVSGKLNHPLIAIAIKVRNDKHLKKPRYQKFRFVSTLERLNL